MHLPLATCLIFFTRHRVMEDTSMRTQQIRKIPVLFTALLGVLITQTGMTCETWSTMTGLKNATYSGIQDEPVTLSNGNWEGPPYVEDGASRPRVGLLKDIILTGDLDADGKEETVAILWQSAGGTGSNTYIAVMKPENESFENISTALIGDRVKLRDGKIDSGKIHLDVLQAGASDPMCCPTQLATRTWTLNGKQLEENEMEVSGQLSVDTLEGSDWLLSRMDNNQSLPDDAEVTLSFAAGRISGRSACNRYAADVTDGDKPGEILIGPTMGTRMACAHHLMEIESLYLKALGQVTGFSFHSGKLALNGLNEDGMPFSMLFISTGMGPHIDL